MGVAGARDLARGRLEGEGEADLGDQLGGAGAHEVGAHDLPVARLGEDLREARGVGRGDRLARGGEREAADAQVVAVARARLGLAEPDPGHLRLARRCRRGRGGDRAAGRGRSARNSTAAMPSSEALCARSGAPARSPIAEIAGRAAARRASTCTKPLRVDRDARRLEAEVRASAGGGRSRPAPGPRGAPRSPSRSTTATRTPAPSSFSSSKRVPSRTSMPLRRNSRWRTAATSGSAPGSICDAISTTVTARRTSRRRTRTRRRRRRRRSPPGCSGMRFDSRASREVSTRSPSTATPGGVHSAEPVASST